MQEVQDLLYTWELPQLVAMFKEHEIDLIALKYLTEKDICELIPKIGPRSVFRACLNKWRLQNGEEITANTLELEAHKTRTRSDLASRPKIVKTESLLNQRTELNEDPRPQLSNKKESDTNNNRYSENSQTSLMEQSEEEFDAAQQLNDKTKRKRIDSSANSIESYDLDEINKTNRDPLYTKTTSMLNVDEILMNNFDGRKAKTFYQMNKNLDFKQRRKIVNVIISAVIDSKIGVHADLFDDIAQQIIALFPNEKHDTYFIPRDGNSCAKGALYNKFINLSRQLRRDGLFDYPNIQNLPGAASVDDSRTTFSKTN